MISAAVWPLALAANRQEFLVSCRQAQLPFLVDVLLGRLKQIGHELLAEPDGFALKAILELDRAVLGFVDQELGLCGEIGHVCSSPAGSRRAALSRACSMA